MFVSVKIKDGEWLVDEDKCNLVPELREVLHDPDLGVKAIAFVAFYSDKTSMFVSVFEKPNERITEIAKYVYQQDTEQAKFVIDSEAVKAAIDKYEFYNNRSDKKPKVRGQMLLGYRANKYAQESSK